MSDAAIVARITQAIIQWLHGDPALLQHLIRTCQPQATMELLDQDGELLLVVHGAVGGGISQQDSHGALVPALFALFGPRWALLPFIPALWDSVQKTWRAELKAKKFTNSRQRHKNPRRRHDLSDPEPGPTWHERAPGSKSPAPQWSDSVPLHTEERVQPRDTYL